MSLLGMVRGLSEASIRYVVIGGVAGTAHGSVRVTDDLDVCYAAESENREALARLLVRWNAYLRGVEPGLPFIMDARTLRDAEVLTLTTSEGYLDLFQRVKGVGDYEQCLARSEEVEVGDVRFAVLGLPALIDAKRATGREKDVEHLRELEALLELQAGMDPGVEEK
jgi:predicted nucleotidyltransferase